MKMANISNQQTSLATTSIFKMIPSMRWWPTSEEELANIEESILSVVTRPFKKYFVDIGEGWKSQSNKINTLEMLTNSEVSKSDLIDSKTEQKSPIVLVHGFGAGMAVWILNLDELASSLNRKIYAIDILGFARSSRPNFDLSENVEDQFVDSIEKWRQEVKLDKFIILGHSFGGYLSANYALKYPSRVSHLIMADPWGLDDKQTSNRSHYKLPLHVRTVSSIFQRFNPLSILRATGPYGPSLIHTFRADIKEKFTVKLKDDSDKILDYLYHCNAQSPTGETAFKSLTLPYGWAKNPLVKKLVDLDPSITVTFIYGSKSWIGRSPGEYVREILGQNRVGLYTIQGSGHHVYADKYNDFNDIIKEVCEKVPN